MTCNFPFDRLKYQVILLDFLKSNLSCTPRKILHSYTWHVCPWANSYISMDLLHHFKENGGIISINLMLL